MRGKKSLTSTKLSIIIDNDLAVHINTNFKTAFYFGKRTPFHIDQYL